MPKNNNQFWKSSTKPIAIAHRGGAGSYDLDRHRRENTIEAFKAAQKLGYEYLEIDVTNTADNKVIVLHVTADSFEKLLHKPSAPSAEKLQKYTYTELKKLLGRDIPVLEDVLTSMPKTKFFIDPKTNDVVEPLARVIKQTKSMNRLCLNSFFLERVVRLQKILGSSLNTGIIIGRHPRPFNQRLKALKSGLYFDKGLQAIIIPRRFMMGETIRLIHMHQTKVLAWGLKNESQINKAIKLRVDGIITDNIKLLKQVLEP